MVLHLTSCVCLGPVAPAFIPPAIAAKRANDGRRPDRVLEIIQECGVITRNSLTKRTQYIKELTRADILSDLIKRGKITETITKNDGPGRPVTWYYAV